MSDAKVLSRMESDLQTQHVLWHGECWILDLTQRAKSQALVAVTAAGLHFYEKKTFGISHEAVRVQDVSELLGDGISVETDSGGLPGLSLKLGRSSVVLAPIARDSSSVTDLRHAVQVATTTDKAAESGAPAELALAEEPEQPEQPEQPAKLTKAQRLEAKAARLREAEERRAEQRRQAVESGTPNPPSRGRGWFVATVALSAVAAVFIALFVVFLLAWQHQRDSAAHERRLATEARAADAGRATVLKAAETFAVDFGAYDYQHLDADFAKAASLMTPSFAKDYTQTSKKIEPTLVQYKTQVTARVQGAGITSASTTDAVVVLFLDQTVTTSQSSTPRIDRNRLQITLQKEKGKWLVSKLDAK